MSLAVVTISQQICPSSHRIVHLTYLLSDSVKRRQQNMTTRHETVSAFRPPRERRRGAGTPRGPTDAARTPARLKVKDQEPERGVPQQERVPGKTLSSGRETPR